MLTINGECIVIAGVLPTLTQQASCHLPADSNYNIGFGTTDEFLVGRKNNNTITKFQCSDSVLTTIWEKPVPAGVPYYSYKFITDPSGDIVLYDWGSTTGIYSSDLSVLKADHAAPGRLSAVTSSSLLYNVRDDGGWITVDIYNLQGDRTQRLAPPPGRTWYNPSVVAVDDTGDVMVADFHSRRLIDVFSATGTIISHTR